MTARKAATLKLLMMVIIAISTLPTLGAGSWYFGQYSVMMEAGQMPLSGKVNGYEDIVFKVSNKSANDHIIEIKLSGNKNSSQLQSISKTLNVASGETVNAYFIKPYLSMDQIEVKVWIDKSLQKSFELQAYKGDGSNNWSSPTSLLLSDKLSYDFFDGLVNTNSKNNAYSENRITVFRSEELPDTPHAYSGFDCVLFPAKLIEKASEGSRDTLYNYVRAGGSLFVYGQFKPQITAINSKNDGILSYYEYGLGLIVIAKTTDYSKIESLKWDQVSSGLWRNKPFIYNYMHPGNAINDWCKIVTVSPVPSKIMVAIIVLMIIIIGPVNILVLRLINKPILMFVTVPVISLIAAAAILTFSITQEGTENTEKISGFTILDQRTGLASTAAVVGYYCPFLPINELNFSYDTQVIPLNLSAISSYSDKRIELNGSQRFYGGWVNSRVPSHFAAIKTSSGCKPLVGFKTTDANDIEITNFSDKNIVELRYKSNEDLVWEAQNIAPGQKTVMALYEGSKSSLTLFPIRNMIGTDWLKSGSRIYSTPYQDLYPGCYIAKFDDELFLEKPTSDQKTTGSYESYVYGITGEEK